MILIEPDLLSDRTSPALTCDWNARSDGMQNLDDHRWPNTFCDNTSLHGWEDFLQEAVNRRAKRLGNFDDAIIRYIGLHGPSRAVPCLLWSTVPGCARRRRTEPTVSAATSASSRTLYVAVLRFIQNRSAETFGVFFCSTELCRVILLLTSNYNDSLLRSIEQWTGHWTRRTIRCLETDYTVQRCSVLCNVTSSFLASQVSCTIRTFHSILCSAC